MTDGEGGRGPTMLRRHLLVWLVLTSGIAFFWPVIADAVLPQQPMDDSGSHSVRYDPLLTVSPETGRAAPRVSIGLLVAVIMFSIGTLLPRDEVAQVARRWPAVLGGTCVQYTIMPLLAMSLVAAVHLPRELAIGVILVGCVPGAMASNVLTLAAGGNVSYSVSLTTLATLVSPIVVPQALRIALHTQATVDAWAISIQLLREAVGPVIAGFTVCRFSETVASVLRRVSGPVANLAILWVIATVVALNRGPLQQISPTILGVLLAMNAAGYLAGYGAAAAFGFSEGMRRALTLEVGMQNAGVGTALALKWFADTPEAAIPTAAYTFGCMLTGTALARWFAARDVATVAATS